MSKTAEKPQLLLKHHLKQLKLPTFLAEYEKQLMSALKLASIMSVICCGWRSLN